MTQVLRRPADMLESAIYFNAQPRSSIRAFIAEHADYQAKYLVHGGPREAWPPPLKATPATPELAHAAATTLSSFEVVGRTEELGSFVARLARLLGVAPPGVGAGSGGGLLLHAHSTARTHHPYELSDDDRSWMHQVSPQIPLLPSRPPAPQHTRLAPLIVPWRAPPPHCLRQHLITDEWLYDRTFHDVAEGIVSWPRASFADPQRFRITEALSRAGLNQTQHARQTVAALANKAAANGGYHRAGLNTTIKLG